MPQHLYGGQKTGVSSPFPRCRFRSSDLAASLLTTQPSHQPHILFFRAYFRDPRPAGQAHAAGTSSPLSPPPDPLCPAPHIFKNEILPGDVTKWLDPLPHMSKAPGSSPSRSSCPASHPIQSDRQSPGKIAKCGGANSHHWPQVLLFELPSHEQQIEMSRGGCRGVTVSFRDFCAFGNPLH